MPDAAVDWYAGVQDRLRRGWNTWDTRSVLSHVLLPDGVLVSFGLKEYYRGNTLRHAQIGRRDADDERVVLGPHAIDGDGTDVTVTWRDIVMRVRTAHDGDDLVALIEPLHNQAKAAALTVAVAYAWNRPGSTARTADHLSAEGPRGVVDVYASAPQADDPYTDVDCPHLVLPLTEDIAVATGRRRSVDEVRAVVERRSAALADGDELEHIVRDSVAWNTVYDPSADRVITTVSRLWNVGKRGGYAMFCWDAFFGALLAGCTSPDLAFANVVEMLREATPEGFVPNVAQGTGRTTRDGSQPPFASLIAWQLAEHFDEPRLLEVAFPALLAWNRWWWRVRRYDDLLCLGSTAFVPDSPSPQDIPRIHQHFGATCESGADNHPVFADVPFDEELSLLRAHDVGLNSEYVLDCEYLARIAARVGDTAAQHELERRHDDLARSVRARLWDEGSGIYRSHFIDTGEPTASLSPMSFFPLFAGVSDGDQTASACRYLAADAAFGGEWVIPVTPRGDASTARQDYWSGRVWPPINFLVYLGLLRTGRDDDRARIVERSRTLVMKEWREHRHVHENYSSATGEGCDVANSEPFLTWGGLLALIPLIEARKAPFFSEWTAG